MVIIPPLCPESSEIYLLKAGLLTRSLLKRLPDKISGTMLRSFGTYSSGDCPGLTPEFPFNPGITRKPQAMVKVGEKLIEKQKNFDTLHKRIFHVHPHPKSPYYPTGRLERKCRY